jgi:hypothetical protein
MQTSRGFILPLLAVGLTILGFATPRAILAGGRSGATANHGASPQPKPDETKKIWSNDDFPSTRQAFRQIDPVVEAQTVTTLPATAQPAVLQSLAPSTTIAPAQDPQFYAQQLEPLESELAAVAAKEQQLRDFRATGTGLQTGLNLAAPCEGFTTDNYIAQLDARRQELEQQIESTEETAREHGVDPGAAAEIPVTPAEQRAAIAVTYREQSRQLQETQETLAAIRADAASQGITLHSPALPNATNQTSNLLEQLNDRANQLQDEIGNDEDEARHAGIDPSRLP